MLVTDSQLLTRDQALRLVAEGFRTHVVLEWPGRAVVLDRQLYGAPGMSVGETADDARRAQQIFRAWPLDVEGTTLWAYVASERDLVTVTEALFNDALPAAPS